MTYSTKLAEMCVSCGLGRYDIEAYLHVRPCGACNSRRKNLGGC